MFNTTPLAVVPAHLVLGQQPLEGGVHLVHDGDDLCSAIRRLLLAVV